jgi:citrate synthase
MSAAPDQVPSEAWWSTSIIEMQPGMIRYHGYPIEELIGRISFPAMIWLMLRGELPEEGQAELLGTALTAAVDHGPQAPSIAIARMAMTCGVGINSAMASAINRAGLRPPLPSDRSESTPPARDRRSGGG